MLFQQHKRRLYTCTSPHGKYWNQIDYILCSQRWRRSIQSAKTRPRADCGSDHELLIAKFRLKLKKVGKITRLFRFDLNPLWIYSGSDKQIQGIRADRVWGTMDRGLWHCTGGSDQYHLSKKNKWKKAKWLSEEALQIAEKGSERQRRKGKIYPSECRVWKNWKER